jgi:hypothetical protein
MDDISAVVSLKYVVMQVFDDMEVYSQRKYRHYLNIARNGLVELQTHVIKDVKTVQLDIDPDTGIVSFPDDYLYFTSIGVIRNNQMYPIVRNDSIPMSTGDSCAEESNDYKTVKYQTGVKGHYTGKMYNATGGNYYVKYRLDHKNRRIFFQGYNPSDKIHMEYISTGVPADSSEVMIPRYIVAALKEWIHWKKIEYNPTVAYNEKDRRERSYYHEARKAAKVKRPLNLTEIMDAIHSASQSTPKR